MCLAASWRRARRDEDRGASSRTTTSAAPFQHVAPRTTKAQIFWGAGWGVGNENGPRRPVFPSDLAERVGFEPTVRYDRTPDFESGAFDHSATSPDSCGRQVVAEPRILAQPAGWLR
jgi:hypothetical protein